MNNSIEWLIAYFGIVRTGAWVVPLNFRFTSDDIKYCADVAEPDILVFGGGVRRQDRSDKRKARFGKALYLRGGRLPAVRWSLPEAACRVPVNAGRRPHSVRRPLRALLHVRHHRPAEAHSPDPSEHGERLRHGEPAPFPDKEGHLHLHPSPLPHGREDALVRQPHRGRRPRCS